VLSARSASGGPKRTRCRFHVMLPAWLPSLSEPGTSPHPADRIRGDLHVLHQQIRPAVQDAIAHGSGPGLTGLTESARVVGPGRMPHFLRLGVCDSVLAAADLSSCVASGSARVRPAAEAACALVWSDDLTCARALAAADLSSSVASGSARVRPAAEAASGPVCLEFFAIVLTSSPVVVFRPGRWCHTGSNTAHGHLVQAASKARPPTRSGFRRFPMPLQATSH
jgi:hypothetical protein